LMKQKQKDFKHFLLLSMDAIFDPEY
jgi:hypothetical protein